MSRSPAAREKWSRIVDEQRSSGLTVKQFCAERSLIASTLFVWRRKLAVPPAEGMEGKHTMAFVEATLGGQSTQRENGARGCTGGVMIEVPCGRRIIVERGFDRCLLLDVITALESKVDARAEA